MKKIILLSSLPIITFLPIATSVSCSSQSDFKVMAWNLDRTKVDAIKKGDWQTFNKETTSFEKLKKVITGDGSISRYTTDAFNEGLFEYIKFETDSKNNPTKLVIKLRSKKDGKDCPYRLPNNSLEWKF